MRWNGNFGAKKQSHGRKLWHTNCFYPAEEYSMRLITDFFFLFLFFVLVIVWLMAWAAFHVAGGAIHLLLIIAVVCLLIHFLRGRSRVA
jgi:hypothetical protein